MDKKSKILIAIVGVLIVASVAVTYWKIMIKKDYIITAQADCDPSVEVCFIYECDPEAEECTGNPEEDIWYFKNISRKAANIPLCDPNDENCEALTCPEGEAECEIAYCAPENEEGVECTNPVDFQEEAEEVECEEGDEECLATQEEAEVICEEGDEECLASQVEEGEEAACEEGDAACEAEVVEGESDVEAAAENVSEAAE